MLAHPQVVPHERLLALFDRAGMVGHTAAPALQAVTAWLLGYLLVERRAMVDNHELPRLRAIAPGLAEHGGPELPAAGLDALLDRFITGT